jgi:copper homeostasis protein
MHIKIEIAAFSAVDAITAFRAGADRIELCASILDGGISPSYGNIWYARQNMDIPIFVMIRPRGGDFVYSASEIEVMKADILFCKQNNIDGVVFGVLNPDYSVDIATCRELAELAKPMQTTFHRAFDRTADPVKSLEEIINCGFDRILTSGQKPTAPEGKLLLKDLVSRAAGRIAILPGSGIEPSNLAELHKFLKAEEYHSSAKAKKEQANTMGKISMSSVGTGTEIEWIVSSEIVSELCKICRNL